MPSRNRILITLALLCAFGLACRKNDSGPSWDVDVLAPILRANLTLKNIIADSLLTTAPDGALSIEYNGVAFSLSLDTLVNIPNETVQDIFVLPFGTIKLGPGEAIPTLGNSLDETKYDLNGVELKEVKIRSGSIKFELGSSIQEVVDLYYQMPSALKDGIPFSIQELIPAGTQSSLSTFSASYDLSGYVIDMRGVNLNDFNTIIAQFSAIIDSNATDTVVINAGDKFDIKYTFKDIKTEYAIGYFGSYDISDSYTDTFDLFNSISSGLLDLDSVGMIMKIENGFGIDAQLRLDTLRSINTGMGIAVDLSHSVIGNPINLTRALNVATAETPFTYSEYNITINSDNSNIDGLIETLPDQFKYAFVLKVNPFGNSSNGNDFLYYDSDLKISVDLKVPAKFSADGLTIMDTLDFDIGNDPDKDHETTITEGFFYIFANNGFPFEAKLQVYLYDDNFLIIDSMFVTSANTIQAAPVDQNYKVTSQVESRLDIPVDDDKMIGFENATKAIIKVVFTTKPDNQIMTIYSDYSLDLKLVGDLTYRLRIK